MKITDELIEKSKGLISLHPEINDWTGKNYQMFDDGGVELETAEFLYGLLRILKPQHVLETGCYTGISSMYMGQACKDNGFGSVETLEIANQHKQRAEDLWKRTEVNDFVTCHLVSSKDFNPEIEYDFMFLDSEPQLRFDELVRFYPKLKPGSFLFIHDLHRHMSQEPNEEHGFGSPFGRLPEEIVNWVKDDELRPIHFPTPRGLMGFYKTDPRDYKWK